MKAWIWLFITLIGVAISLTGLLFGAWWLTFAAGLVIGVFIGQGRVAIPAGALAGLVSWGFGLAILQVYFGLGSAARSLAAIMGFTGQPAIPLILTCVVGLLLGLTGAWLASALRGLLVPATR
ncbi:MAG TPA: hypothetical protein VIO80_15740 [Candidatus Dormibacteraeota bacterium]